MPDATNSKTTTRKHEKDKENLDSIHVRTNSGKTGIVTQTAMDEMGVYYEIDYPDRFPELRSQNSVRIIDEPTLEEVIFS